MGCVEARLRLADTTKLTIELQSILKGLDKTLKGLASIRKSLESVASVKLGTQATDRAAASTQKFANQQQRLAVQSQELANRQERARQTTERLALSNQRLNNTQQQAARSAGAQADAHVRVFKAIERGLARAPQADAHVKAFRAIQKGADDADAHVRAFRANEAALAKAPQLDTHVKAFRSLEAAAKSSSDRLTGIGNSLRGLGQGLASIGATLSVAVTAPLVALGGVTVNAAVELDSLRRGLTAIVGSADEAARQLQRLTQLARLPGIGFEEAIQGSIRLQAVGFSAKEAESALRQFSNAIALTGGGRDELARVTIQLGQLAAKGKVLSQDLRPIIEAAPAVGRALLQAFGTVNSEDIQALGLSSKEFLSILVSQLGELPRAAAGAKNSFENFRDEIFRASAAVGEAFLPALIRLAEVVGPVITKLADAFTKLPQPVQLVAIGVTALLAALGPVLFVVGQLTLGTGRLLVGFVELNIAGILPTIANLRALTAGTLGAAAAQRTLAASSALLFGIFGGIVAVIAAGITAYAIYNSFQKDAVSLSRERADQLTAEIDALDQQAKFLNGLQSGVEHTADEQQRLSDIYDKLNIQAQIRVAGITDEQKRLIVLRVELEKLIQLRGEERTQQAASVAAQIAESAATITVNDRSRQSIAGRISANNALVETLQREGRITSATRDQLERLGQSASVDVARAIENLQQQSARLIQRQRELGDNTEETRKELEGYLEALRALDPRHQLTARQLLILAHNMGLFKGDVEATVPVLEAYIQKTDEAAKSTDKLNVSLSENVRHLLQIGEQADKAAKHRRALIDAQASLAREVSVDFAGARKSLEDTIDAIPEVRAALERERQLTGKSLKTLLDEATERAFAGRTSKSATSLRNAQEELAKALAQVALASSEEQVRIEKEKNDRVLQATEVAQKLQLISYREFLETRADLAAASIDKEITQQAAIVAAAKNAQARLIGEASKAGIPAAERTRRQAQAAKANEEEIKARGKLNDLVGKREQIQVELQQALRLVQREQVNDIRQLDIEFAQLQGHIEEALNAATVEKFRERLTDLALTQSLINKQLDAVRKARDADRIAQLTEAQRLNQSQIDVIELLVQQERANNNLAAAQELVRRAEEKQADLESRLAFEVENRGLKEEDAIKQRLDGERKLAASLELARDITRDTIADLQAKGVEPPQALIEFVRDLNASLRGLGELSFSEQFRLAQKEFDRINDERIAKIADVERAVRNRDIAEVEGAILIRRINGQYTADLEQQLILLKRLAEASGQTQLKQQADQAGEIVKDTRDQVAGLSAQIDAAGKDAFRSGLTEFFSDILNRTATAKEALLNLLNSVTTAINNTIAENLSKKLFESLFGGPDTQAGSGIIAGVKRLFGFGGGGTGQGAGAATEAISHATEATAHTAEATAAATALTTGATAAATALATGGTTAGTSLIASMTAAATGFASAVIAAGATFAATVAAASAASGISQGLGGLGGALGGAATGMFPAVPGGAIRVLEGGHPEAILTTDPQYATSQMQILRDYLAYTKGLSGRIRGFAMGGMVSRESIEGSLLGSLQRSPVSLGSAPDLALAAGRGSDLTLRQIFVDDQRDISNWYNSAEGDQVQVQWIARNRPRIRKLLGVRD